HSRSPQNEMLWAKRFLSSANRSGASKGSSEADCYQQATKHLRSGQWNFAPSTPASYPWNSANTLASFACAIGRGDERREALGVDHKRLLYCVNVNRTSLDHLLLGESADIDKMSNGPSITPG